MNRVKLAFNHIRIQHTLRPSASIYQRSRGIATMSSQITVKQIESRNPDPKRATEHHIGSPPSGFQNPWPSFVANSGLTLLKTRFGNNPERGLVPVPQGPDGSRSKDLVKVRKPDWGQDKPDRLRATWIGHASFLIETPATKGADRGIRILFDPVFSEKTGPYALVGPKRYTPTPCSIDEVPDVDIVCISHNHYDHLDYHVVAELYRRRKDHIHFVVGLHDKAWFTHNVCPASNVTELDWWEGCDVEVNGLGRVRLTCTPSQHGSARGIFDKDYGLWCSWALESDNRKVYFAGDTAYQAAGAPSPCPIFQQIGEELGPFDLSLLPIGLFKPQNIMASVHCSPEQALEIHKEVRSKLSLGMHYGTVRGGISGQYEDVREPPRRWREAAEKEGLWRGGGVEGNGESVATDKEGVGLCDVGETVAV